MSDTWIDAVKDYFPNATDEQADAFIWNCTCFPAGTKDQIFKQMKEACENSNGDIEVAFKQADDHIRKVMRELNEKLNRTE